MLKFEIPSTNISKIESLTTFPYNHRTFSECLNITKIEWEQTTSPELPKLTQRFAIGLVIRVIQEPTNRCEGNNSTPRRSRAALILPRRSRLGTKRMVCVHKRSLLMIRLQSLPADPWLRRNASGHLLPPLDQGFCAFDVQQGFSRLKREHPQGWSKVEQGGTSRRARITEKSERGREQLRNGKNKKNFRILKRHAG